MNFVEPIRDKRKIQQIKNMLKGAERYRDLLLFTVGVNSALRASDLLRLQVGHFLRADGRLRDRFTIQEEKTSKRYELTVNESIREVWELYVLAYPDLILGLQNYLFFNTATNDYSQPIGRIQAWRLIRGICQDAGLTGEYGTHTLRKTWGYQARAAGVDIAMIMNRLNHSSLASTLRYLGITDDELAAVVNRLNL